MLEKICPEVFSSITDDYVVFQLPEAIAEQLKKWVNQEHEANWVIQRLDVHGNLIICKNSHVQLPSAFYKKPIAE